MPEVPFDRCFRCHYSIEGLPRAHRCPECGQEYDEHVRVWRPARRYSPLGWSSLALVPPALYFGRAVVGHLRQGAPFPLCETFGFLVPIGIFVVAFVRLWPERALGRLATVTGQGVFVRYGRRSAMVPWSDVGGVTAVSGYAYLTDYHVLGTEIDVFNRKQHDAETFATVVREWKARFGEPTTTASEPTSSPNASSTG